MSEREKQGQADYDMETTIQKINNQQLNEVLIAGKRASDIYKWMKFRAIDNRIYDVWNVYVSRRGCLKISVSAIGWWNPQDVREWLPSVGEGMSVQTSTRTGKIVSIQPNRVCHVKFADGTHKSYQEKELLIRNK